MKNAKSLVAFVATLAAMLEAHYGWHIDPRINAVLAALVVAAIVWKVPNVPLDTTPTGALTPPLPSPPEDPPATVSEP